MSDNNLFQEVDDDMERQRLAALWNRYAPIMIIGAVLIVGSTAGYTAWRNWVSSKNEKATVGLSDIVTKKDQPTGQEMADLEQFALKNKGSQQAALAEVEAGKLAAKDGNRDRSVQLYDRVANDPAVDPAIRQYADLMSVHQQMDTGDAALLLKRLEPLTAENAPWRLAALEDQAFLALKAGDKAKALQIFTDLSKSQAIPYSLKDRATDMARYLAE